MVNISLDTFATIFNTSDAISDGVNPATVNGFNNDAQLAAMALSLKAVGNPILSGSAIGAEGAAIATATAAFAADHQAGNNIAALADLMTIAADMGTAVGVIFNSEAPNPVGLGFIAASNIVSLGALAVKNSPSIATAGTELLTEVQDSMAGEQTLVTPFAANNASSLKAIGTTFSNVFGTIATVMSYMQNGYTNAISGAETAVSNAINNAETALVNSVVSAGITVGNISDSVTGTATSNQFTVSGGSAPNVSGTATFSSDGSTTGVTANGSNGNAIYGNSETIGSNSITNTTQNYSSNGTLLDTQSTTTSSTGNITQTLGATDANGNAISISDQFNFGANAGLTNVTFDGSSFTYGGSTNYETFMSSTTGAADTGTTNTANTQAANVLSADLTAIVNNVTSSLASLGNVVSAVASYAAQDNGYAGADDTYLGDGEDIYDYYAESAYTTTVTTSDPNASYASSDYTGDPYAGDGGGDYSDDSGDPLVISTNRGSINLTSLAQSGVQFDFGGFNAKEATGWTGSNTGFLVLQNGSGTITGSNLLNFQQLATLDVNHDGVINATDPAFANLAVWVDANNDGVYESGELVTLASLGITSINVQSTASSTTIAGNTVTATGTVTYTDNSTGAIDDVTFATPSQAITINGESATALAYLQRVLQDLPAAAEGAAEAAVQSLNTALNTLAAPDAVLAHDEGLSKPAVGSNSLSATQIYTVNTSQIYFDGNVSGTGTGNPANQLWVTNGTASGTQQASGGEPSGTYVSLGALTPQNCNNFNAQNVSNSITLGTTGYSLYEQLNSSNGLYNLWDTNGTTSQELTQFSVTSGQNYTRANTFVALGNNEELFQMSPLSGGLAQLWITNGTAAGTTELTNNTYTVTYPGGSRVTYGVDGTNFVPIANGEELFSSYGSNGQSQLWITDGAAAGTQQLTSVSYAGSGQYGSTTYYGLQPNSYNAQLLASSAPTLARQAESGVNQAVQATDLAAQYVQYAATDQTKSESAAIAANTESAVIGSADDVAAYKAATVTENDWQAAFSSLVTASASLQGATNSIATAQSSLNSLGGMFATTLDAQEAADAATEQKTSAQALGISEAAYQSLLAAAAQAWNVNQVTLASSGQTLTAAGGDLIVAAPGSETLSDGSTPSTYAILQGANVAIANFHAGANGSRLDFLSGATTATFTQTANGVQITAGSSTVTLTGVTMSSLSLFDNFAGVKNAQLSGAQMNAGLNPGGNFIDDGMTHFMETSFGSGGGESITGGGNYTIYNFAKGDGADTIINGLPANSAPGSELDFGSGVAASSLSFAKSGNDLAVGVTGTSDQVTVQGWFANSYSELDAIQAGDGTRFTTVDSGEILSNNSPAGTSQAILFAPLPGAANEYQNFSGLNGTGADTQNIINWTAGGSQEQSFTGLPGGVTEEISNFSGTGATGTLLGTTVDIANNAQVSTNFTSDAINVFSGDTVTAGSGDTVVINGAGDTVNSAAGNTVNVAGNGQTSTSSLLDNMNMSSGTIGIAASSGAGISGNGNNIVGGSYTGEDIIVAGNNNTIGAGSGSNVWINSGNGNTLNAASGDTVNVAASLQANMYGSNLAIYASASDNVSINSGTNNTVNTTGADTITIAGNGQTTSGYDTVNMSNGTITMASASSASISGGGNNIVGGSYNSEDIQVAGNSNTVGAGGGSNIWLNNGTGNTVNAATGDTITIAGNGQGAGGYDNVYMSGGTVNVAGSASASISGGGNNIVGGSNSSEDIQVAGNSNTIGAGGGSNVWLNSGTGSTVNAAAGDSVNVAGNGQTTSGYDNVNMSGGTINVASSASASISGNGNNTVGGSNNSEDIQVAGNSNTIGAGSGSNVWINGGAGNTVNGMAGDSVNIAGNGQGSASSLLDNVNMAGGTINVTNSSSVNVSGNGNNIVGGSNTNEDIIVAGNSNTIGAGSGSNIWLNSGTGDTINGASGDTVNVGANATVTINGSSMVINVSAGDNITINGTNDQMVDAGNATYTLTANGTLLGTGSYAGSYGFAGNQSAILADINSNTSYLAAQDISQGNNAGAVSAEAALQQVQNVVASGDQSAVLEGAKWDSSTVTWSLADSPGTQAASFSGYMGKAYDKLVQAALNVWGAVTGLTFQEVSDSSQSDIRIGWQNLDTQASGVVGYTSYQSNNGQMQPDTIIQLENPNQDALVSGANGQLTYSGTDATLGQVLLHEIGHSLGFADNANPTSIMDYYLGGNNRTLSGNDVAAAQSLYGTASTDVDTEAAYLRLIQAMASFGADKGAVVTTSGFGDNSLTQANNIAIPLHSYHS